MIWPFKKRQPAFKLDVVFGDVLAANTHRRAQSIRVLADQLCGKNTTGRACENSYVVVKQSDLIRIWGLADMIEESFR